MHVSDASKLVLFVNSSGLHTPSCLIAFFPFNTWHISTLILYQLTQSCLILFTGCILFQYVARPYILGPVPRGWALWLLPLFAIIRDAATANVLVNMCTCRRNPYRGCADRSRYAFLSLPDSAVSPRPTFPSCQRGVSGLLPHISTYVEQYQFCWSLPIRLMKSGISLQF